jgi:hypothetical protein
MDAQDLLGLTYFTLIFSTLAMITGACLKRRIDALAKVLEELDEKYVS